jgi:hypothetical protein
MHFSTGLTRPVIAGFAIAVMLSLAHAYGTAEWIQRGGYVNAVGELCCGERDRVEITSADVDVKVTSSGYLIVSLNEVVPFSEATPSPTGTYWRCFWGGKRKCFFAPLNNT